MALSVDIGLCKNVKSPREPLWVGPKSKSKRIASSYIKQEYELATNSQRLRKHLQISSDLLTWTPVRIDVNSPYTNSGAGLFIELSAGH